MDWTTWLGWLKEGDAPLAPPVDVERLRRLLEERGVSVREFARAAGVGVYHIYPILKGDLNPGVAARLRIARGVLRLGLDAEQVLREPVVRN